MGGFTYDLNLLGKDLGKPEKVEPSVEESRRKDFLLASSFAAQCAASPNARSARSPTCRTPPIFSRKPHCSPRTEYAAKLSDEIGIALAPRIADSSLAKLAWRETFFREESTAISRGVIPRIGRE